jgi:hypothetical protein
VSTLQEGDSLRYHFGLRLFISSDKCVDKGSSLSNFLNELNCERSCPGKTRLRPHLRRLTGASAEINDSIGGAMRTAQ